MKSNRNILNHRSGQYVSGARELEHAKLLKVLIVFVLIVGTFGVSPALSSLASNVTIKSGGQIAGPIPTITAASGYWQDIQTAVNWVVAHGGIGNVYIPEGTFNFVNVGEAWGGVEAGRVNIPAGVNVFGAPTERDSNGQVTSWRTVLVLPWDVPGHQENNGISWFKISGNEDPSKPSRISDIKLVGYRSFNASSVQFQAAVRVQGVCDFRIDHCYFEHTTLGIQVWGVYSHGVIDHCYLVNPVFKVGTSMGECTVQYGVVMGRGYGDYWDTNTQNVLGHYTDYTTFIEDCYFSGWRHCTAGNNGAHYVIRYCTINEDSGFGSIDAHGWGVADANGVVTQVGTRAVEMHNNVIVNSTQDPYCTFIRGGAGVSFSNYAGGGHYSLFMYFSNESSIDLCKTREWYVWNNTVASGMTMSTVSDFLVETKPSWYAPYPYPHPLTLETTP